MDQNREPRRDPNEPRRTENPDRGISTGAIIAIVVAVLLVLLLILALGGVFGGDPGVAPPNDVTPTPATPQAQIEVQPGQPGFVTLPLLYTPQLA